MPTVHLWKDMFQCFELTQNVRQRGDSQYASLLNRIRTGTHTAYDIHVLKSRKCSRIATKRTVQHIFPTKDQCKTVNGYKL